MKMTQIMDAAISFLAACSFFYVKKLIIFIISILYRKLSILKNLHFYDSESQKSVSFEIQNNTS